MHYLVRVVLTTFLGLFLLSALSCASHNENDPTPVLSGPPNTTFPMPPLTANAELGWLTADAQRARVGDYRGKVLVLDFYATWCAPCRQSIPELNDLQRRFTDKGLQIVGLNVGGADDRVKVPGFATELNIGYPLGFPDKSLTDVFLSDNQTIPQTFVFGRDGVLVKRFIGFQSSTGKELEAVIESAIAKS